MKEMTRILAARNGVIRKIACVTAALFLITQTFNPLPAFGQRVTRDNVRLHSSELSFLEELPSPLGAVRELWKAGEAEGPFVLLIQAAHAHPEAQRNIQRMLEWIHGRKNSAVRNGQPPVRLHVAVEGSV